MQVGVFDSRLHGAAKSLIQGKSVACRGIGPAPPCIANPTMLDRRSFLMGSAPSTGIGTVIRRPARRQGNLSLPR